MSAWREEQSGLRAKPDACAIAVVYENVRARNLAIEVCDALAQKFMGDLEFDISWWRFEYLADPHIAGAAANASVKADLILVCLSSEELPLNIKAWFEQWVSRHETPDAAMAVLRTSAQTGDSGAAEAYLRLAASRAKLDYLALAGPGRAAGLMDRLREDEVSSDNAGPDQGSDRPYHSGWGINE